MCKSIITALSSASVGRMFTFTFNAHFGEVFNNQPVFLGNGHRDQNPEPLASITGKFLGKYRKENKTFIEVELLPASQERFKCTCIKFEPARLAETPVEVDGVLMLSV